MLSWLEQMVHTDCTRTMVLKASILTLLKSFEEGVRRDLGTARYSWSSGPAPPLSDKDCSTKVIQTGLLSGEIEITEKGTRVEIRDRGEMRA